MKVTLWGVRGSVPVPGPATVRYGGNTPCIEVVGASGEYIILDVGTGAHALGRDLLSRPPLPSPIHLFISHTHWDHIQGFPFFAPCYVPGVTVHVRGPVHFHQHRQLRDVFDQQMQFEFFPISNSQLAATITYESLAETSLSVGSLTVTTQFMNHSVQCLGYRICEQNRTMVYTGDHEPYYNVFVDGADPLDDPLVGDAGAMVDRATERFLSFLSGADLVIIDCQYTPTEYPVKKRTWGHSSWDYCLTWMQQAAVRCMVLTHHDPLRSDDALDAMTQDIHRAAAERGIDPDMVLIAREGMELSL
ncbi:MAG: MBL fold metallo-hydrolase [Desulfobacterota bacterium]|nr:MBL fold metallo-hydrolase [Thermodesulfobacteriota bacterium]